MKRPTSNAQRPTPNESVGVAISPDGYVQRGAIVQPSKAQFAALEIMSKGLSKAERSRLLAFLKQGGAL